MRSLRLLASVVVTVAALGCGGNGASSPDPVPTPTPTPKPRRTDAFPFTLPAGSVKSVVVGPVFVRSGPLEVKLAFSGDFVILACVGTPSVCTPMGGRPSTSTFNITNQPPTSNKDYPEGEIQASVYFNDYYRQPPGDARGTVSFTYNPR